MTPEKPTRVLFIAAHPDDTELSCGGTIAKWSAAGHEIFYVICTNGDKGTHDRSLSSYRLAELREAEQLEAAHSLGVSQAVFLRHSDGELEPNVLLRTELAMLIRHLRPQVIFTHDGWRRYQIHPDHRAVGIATGDAIVSARDHLFLPAMTAIGLEAFAPSELYLWGPEEPDYYEDISETIDRKIAAVAAHKTQLAQMGEWEPRVRQWAADTGQKAGLSFAEAFKRIAFRPVSHVIPNNDVGRSK
jgi:LmbE family N-acetylglucosaminyl deacetylase